MTASCTRRIEWVRAYIDADDEGTVEGQLTDEFQELSTRFVSTRTAQQTVLLRHQLLPRVSVASLHHTIRNIAGKNRHRHTHTHTENAYSENWISVSPVRRECVQCIVRVRFYGAICVDGGEIARLGLIPQRCELDRIRLRARQQPFSQLIHRLTIHTHSTQPSLEMKQPH